MENFEVKKNVDEYSQRLSELANAIDFEELSKKIALNEQEIAKPDFYNDYDNASIILKQLKKDKEILSSYKKLESNSEDLKVYYDLQKTKQATEEELDSDIRKLINELETELTLFEEKMLLVGEYDDCHALFELHPGAGGTESQDWAEMLFRMFKRFAESSGYEFEVLDYQEGDEAGIKSVSFIVKGDKAYGYLKSEHGVHRLVRISPFDSGARRHTSFCGCIVTPFISNPINIIINPEDIKVDVYRSSGAGGQSVNTTDSAVRITHLKTGIIVTCQNERSQIKNRERALEVLKSKLYKLEEEEKDSQLKKIQKDITVNSFGGQIRSYVFHPYSMVKDHRTNYEVGNVNAVMDGDLKGFINAYLKSNEVIKNA